MSINKRRSSILRAVSLRLPKDLYTQISLLAEREDRSLNQQIVWALKCYIANRKNYNEENL